MRSLFVVLVLALAGACDSGGTANSDGAVAADLSASAAGPDLALLSRCGHPGDVGNSLGVGQYCTNQGPDCSTNSQAKTCSALLNGSTPSPSDSYFCSLLCMATDPPDKCGENATCLCNATGGCACIPTSCVPKGDGGP